MKEGIKTQLILYLIATFILQILANVESLQIA